MTGNRVTVDWHNRTVTVHKEDGEVVQSYSEPEQGHVHSTTFDPNNPQPQLAAGEVVVVEGKKRGKDSKEDVEVKHGQDSAKKDGKEE